MELEESASGSDAEVPVAVSGSPNPNPAVASKRPARGSKRPAEAMASNGGNDEATVAYLVEVHAPLASDLQVLASAPTSGPDAVVELSRCAVVAKSAEAAAAQPTGRDRTILYFNLTQRVGSLAGALECIHRHGVNLLNIRSYADLLDGTSVDFIVTAEGHERDAPLAAAISELQGLAACVKVFGSFPRAERAVRPAA